MGKLTIKQVENAKPGRHGDGDGLHLHHQDHVADDLDLAAVGEHCFAVSLLRPVPADRNLPAS